jgi:pyrroline-5-carboxylate reductase
MVLDKPGRELRWAIFGCGEIGKALARGLVANGLPQKRLILVQHNTLKRNALRNDGFDAVNALPTDCDYDILVIAVKPIDVISAISEPKLTIPKQACVITTASGVPMNSIASELPQNTPLFRIKPNLFIEFCHGNILLSKHDKTSQEALRKMKRLLLGLGNCYVLPEEQLEEFGWESLSLPSVIVPAMFKACIDAAPQDQQNNVSEMLLRGLLGSLDYLQRKQSEGRTLSEAVQVLCDKTSTTGGNNEAALSFLEKASLFETLADARNVYVDSTRKLAKRK